MSDSLLLSRSFVEFGPFPTAELMSFYKRGLLKDTDYVRSTDSDEWLHVNDWADADSEPAPVIPSEPAPVTSVVAPEADKPKTPAAKPKAPAAKKTAAKAPAKKAAKK